MSDNQTNGQVKSGSNTAMQIIGRLIASAVILAITAFFTPGFEISGFWALAAAAVVLAVMDYLIVKFTGLQASSFGRGFVGFVLSAIILYVRLYDFLDCIHRWCSRLWYCFLFNTRRSILLICPKKAEETFLCFFLAICLPFYSLFSHFYFSLILFILPLDKLVLFPILFVALVKFLLLNRFHQLELWILHFLFESVYCYGLP